jgi:hypothetical protein
VTDLARLELAACAFVATALATMLVLGVDALRFHADSPAAIIAAAEGLTLAIMGGSFARQLARQRTFVHRLPTTPRRVLGTAVQVLPTRRAHAFTVGFLRPRIVVSEGLLALLDERELLSVLAHERHHARRRDPLRRALVRAVCDGLWFVPGLRATAATHAAISELAADAVAMERAGAQPLASALVKHGGATPERVRQLDGRSRRFTSRVAFVSAGAVLVGLGSAVVYLLQPDPALLCLPLSTAGGAPVVLALLALACVPARVLSRTAAQAVTA